MSGDTKHPSATTTTSSTMSRDRQTSSSLKYSGHSLNRLSPTRPIALPIGKRQPTSNTTATTNGSVPHASSYSGSSLAALIHYPSSFATRGIVAADYGLDGKQQPSGHQRRQPLVHTTSAVAADWMSWSYSTTTASALADDPLSRSVPPAPPPTRLLQSAALNRKLNGTAAAAAGVTLELSSTGRSGAVETLLAASNKARCENVQSSSSSQSPTLSRVLHHRGNYVKVSLNGLWIQTFYYIKRD